MSGGLGEVGICWGFVGEFFCLAGIFGVGGIARGDRVLGRCLTFMEGRGRGPQAGRLNGCVAAFHIVRYPATFGAAVGGGAEVVVAVGAEAGGAALAAAVSADRAELHPDWPDTHLSTSFTQ